MTKRKYTRYATPEQAAEARKAYNREYQRTYSKTYIPSEEQKARTKRKAREQYLLNREAEIDAALKRYRDNPERQKEINRRLYPEKAAKVKARVMSIMEEIGLLAPGAERAYAVSLLLEGDTHWTTTLALRFTCVDHFLAEHSGI